MQGKRAHRVLKLHALLHTMVAQVLVCSALPLAMGRKARGKPNPHLSYDDYYTLFKHWLLRGPAATVQMKIGTFVADFRSATPKSLGMLQELVEMLVEKTKSAVVHGTRVEKALGKLFADHPELLQDPEASDREASRLTDHILAHLYMLRCMASEGDDLCRGQRKYPKSGGFRRLMSSSDWCWLNPVLATISSNQEPQDTSPTSPEHVNIEVDTDGWPVLFAQLLKEKTDAEKQPQDPPDNPPNPTSSSMVGCAPPLARQQSVVSIASSMATNFYDEDGFPTCFGAGGVGAGTSPAPEEAPVENAAPTPAKAEVNDGDVRPITPRARKRKAEAKSTAKQAASDKKAQAKKAHGKNAQAKNTKPSPKPKHGPRDRGLDVVLSCLSICSAKGKTELCAKICGKRLHVLTLGEKWGPTYDEDVKSIAKAIEEQGLTKSGALALRDSMRNGGTQ